MQNTATQAAWLQGAITVEQEGAEARREFIQKVYAHLLVGLMVFSGVTWAMMKSPLVWSGDEPGFLCTMPGWITCFVGMVGLQLMYGRLFSSASLKVHYIAFGLTIALQGAFCAPLFWFAQHISDTILRDAFFITTAGFGGLTAIPFLTKKDFSFMGGMLYTATFILMAVGIMSIFFGPFNMGLFWSGAVVLLFSGWVLYHTSQIQRHLPLTAYVFGATMLFIDFVVLLRQVVIILISLASND